MNTKDIEKLIENNQKTCAELEKAIQSYQTWVRLSERLNEIAAKWQSAN